MNENVVILGASDPEMAEIENVVREEGLRVLFAEVGGRRVHPGNAYKADPIEIPSGTTVILVECSVPLPEGTKVIKVDHHAPGDPGFVKPPEAYLAGSSLGQVLDLLGLEPTKRQRYIAAADHCLGAAYAGQCPGVIPSALAYVRAEQRAKWLRSLPASRPERRAVERNLLTVCPACGMYGEDPGNYALTCENCGVEEWAGIDDTPDGWTQAVLATVGFAESAVMMLPLVRIGGIVVRDARDQEISELPEALAQMGKCAIYRRANPRDGSVKLGIIGAGAGTVAGTAPIRAFLAAAKSGRVIGQDVDAGSAYGDPVRGYAGVTVS